MPDRLDTKQVISRPADDVPALPVIDEAPATMDRWLDEWGDQARRLLEAHGITPANHTDALMDQMGELVDRLMPPEIKKPDPEDSGPGDR